MDFEKGRLGRKTRDMGQTRILLCLCLLIGQEAHGFSFPNDWYKIRQMMEERRRKEQVNFMKKLFQNKTFKDGDVSSRSLDHDCTYWRGEEKGKYKTVTTHDKYQ